MTQFAAAALTVLVLLRVVQILASNPIGQMQQELLYLRARDLRQPLWILLVVVLAEVGQNVFPLLHRRGLLRTPADALLAVDLGQALLVLVASVMLMLVARRYTHRALDRRIRESMETLAYLEGQRRRRRSAERRDWDRRDEE